MKSASKSILKTFTDKKLRGLFEFSLFLGFFPQVIAGPIERGRDFLPQFREPRPLSSTRFGEGAFLILWGLFKKVVVADTIAMRVDPLFAASELNAGMAILAGVGFSFQIYADFSAYTDMARGVARMLGYDLSQNFLQPLFARSPREFWRCWHVTFSNWLRDYLYIPLGGNRRGTLRTHVNVLATFLICGLWHGAAWTFVIWGFYQGVLLTMYATIGRVTMTWRLGACIPRLPLCVKHAVSWLGCYALMVYGWIWFRAESVDHAWSFTSALLQGGFETGFFVELAKTCVYFMPVALYDLICRLTGNEFSVVSRSWVTGGIFIAILIYALLIFGVLGGDTFIYFEF